MISTASGIVASPARQHRVTLRKTVVSCTALAMTLLLSIVGLSLIGSESLPSTASLCALASFGTSHCGLTPDQFDILFQLRLPRLLLAAAVGGSLATAGAGYQALLRNPLAEPYLLGISNGAAVGTMVALVFFGANEWTRPLLAFTGALVATLAVYRLARGRAGATPERLILAGVIVTTFLSSVIVFVTTLMDATRIRSFTFWLLGDLSGTSKALLPVTVTVAIVGALALTLNARSLNLLMLGERDAFDLGVEVGRVRIVVFVVASLLVGSSVAASGSVGYVGLVVPHLARLSLGSDNRITIPAAALGGALFVIVADTVARTVIAPRELPVGAITALIGAPLLEARDLTVAYDHRIAVADVSLTLKPGEITSIIGPNGAGKSTLLRTLNGQLRPSSGSILLDGRPLHQLNRRAISRRIAVVAQEAELRFPVTVLEFVLGGRFAWANNSGWGWETERDLQVAHAVLQETELTELGGRLMNELSGGERQRALMARALATEAPILLLDEPTANLDLSHQATLLALVRNRCDRDRAASLVITHDINLAAQFADNILLMKHGKTVHAGSPGEVLKPQILEEVFEVEVLVDAHPVTGGPRVTPVHGRRS